MNKITKHIPNTITCLNLFSGCVAALFAFQGEYQLASLWIGMAALFDFCDGLAARLLKAYSPLGKELDSLADVVSFGVAPAIMVYTLLQQVTTCAYLPYVAFLIPIFSALRLAKFNIDDRQTSSFIGLPVPANALFWVGICLFATTHKVGVATITPLLLLFSYLMVSELPMLSLKFHNLKIKENGFRYLLIIGAILLVSLLGWSGLAAAIGYYIVLSIIAVLLNK